MLKSMIAHQRKESECGLEETSFHRVMTEIDLHPASGSLIDQNLLREKFI